MNKLREALTEIRQQCDRGLNGGPVVETRALEDISDICDIALTASPTPAQSDEGVADDKSSAWCQRFVDDCMDKCCDLGINNSPQDVLHFAAGRALGILRAERKQIASRTAATGWLPIEGAPKDGTKVLLSDGKGVTTGEWIDTSFESEELVAKGPKRTIYKTVKNESGYWQGDDLSSSVTHYMPLPTTPKDGDV